MSENDLFIEVVILLEDNKIPYCRNVPMVLLDSKQFQSRDRLCHYSGIRLSSSFVGDFLSSLSFCKIALSINFKCPNNACSKTEDSFDNLFN